MRRAVGIRCYDGKNRACAELLFFDWRGGVCFLAALFVCGLSIQHVDMQCAGDRSHHVSGESAGVGAANVSGDFLFAALFSNAIGPGCQFDIGE